MARLNEPPVAPGPSAETVDAVKRRFLRQNRDLAKTNSQQSIRIRNLETEGSRLLAENLSLREQVLQLQNALESQSNRPSFENIDSVKDKLEAKIQELGSLVAELGQIQKANTGPRCKSQTAATRRSPDERQWRSGLGLQEVENSMLPTITEGKYYPRRTMNTDELREILEDPDSHSPDLGPPPVSRFEDEGSIAFNPSPTLEETPAEPAEELEPALSSNLETRKKRRESNPKISIRRVSVFQSPPENSEEGTNKAVRAGAKRKLSVREDEEKPNAAGDSQAEAFRFSRRNTPGTIGDNALIRNTRSQSPERLVLGSKPVNTDPVLSPKKQRSGLDKPDKKALPNARSTRGRLTITRNHLPPALPLLQVPPEPIPTTEIHLDSLPPKTPAAEDIFSPPSAEPSTTRPESKDTPPPGDLTSGDQNGLGGRPSRRARAQVSYKEPSLNTKMRRPGKELVDAVYLHHGGRSSTEPASSTSAVKHESGEGPESWKALTSANGRGRDDEGEVGSPLREKLGRREGGQGMETGDFPEQPRLNSSAASNAISALIAGSGASRRKSQAPSTAQIVSNFTNVPVEPVVRSLPSAMKQTNPVKEDKDDLAIFDFKDSSPSDPPANTRPRIDLAKPARSARRHSSVPTSSTPEERKAEIRGKASAGSLPSLHTRAGSGSGTRSVSFSGPGPSNTATNTARFATREKKTAVLPTSESNLDLKVTVGESGVGNTGSLRAERAASRRKSMML
ncbi:uncharacterized protein BDR25DRAFT_267752 [Lindgomyces ingoldianus]|uniref:Uncharacterized protein n=1 Tax=Lindgomyces ingoldianus TaxID=673940 RepID=A0ACB6QLI1_9PLEO|nr:uncharacterized protein BDR25DRAFT_267752 [Lindgomyces ingoldianus]KAF2466987.1 hypothetical protein BDR25DRAFT_267752 [Lindgomyces ingoldianus]